jgi:uncharacterized protein YfaS (alpha-2-macroglobulin family)
VRRSISRNLAIAAGLLLLAACSRQQAGSVTIVEFSPAGQTDRYTNLSIEFSQAMVLQDRVDALIDSMPISFAPDINVRYKWTDTHTLRILPTEPLRPSTSYTVRIRPDITGSPEVRLRGDRQFRFHTPTIRVGRILHYLERQPDDPRQAVFTITVEFNEAVEPVELSRHLQIRGDVMVGRRPIEFEVLSEKAASALKVVTEPLVIGDEDGALSLRIASGLPAVGGAVPLAEDRVEEIGFMGREDLKVEGVRPQELGARSFGVAIRLSSPADPDQVAPYIEVEPALEYRILEAGAQLQLSGDFRPGSAYTVRLRTGLTARDGSQLEETFEQRVVLRSLEPSIGFASPGIYLARQGLQNVAIESINMEGFHLEIEKVYRNNLVHYLTFGDYSFFSGNLGRRIHEEDIPLSLPRNEVGVVTVNFEQFLSEHQVGLFRLIVREADRYWRSEQKTVLLTDIGMIGKRAGDELSVWTASTRSLEPISGAEITLYSKTNQVLGSARTDAQGKAVLSELARFADEFEPFVVVAENGESFSYLMFEQCEISRADFDVDGRPFLDRGYEAFLYGDRGVYRPGDTVHLASIIRGTDAVVPPSFPVRLRLLRPDGRALLEQQARVQDDGLVEFEVDIPAFAQTGRYQAHLLGPDPDPIGTLHFSVEEFMPDRMKVEVGTDQSSYRTGERLEASVQGTMLFGPPAAGRKLDASLLILAAPFRPDGYASFAFGDPDVEFAAHTEKLSGMALDDQGRADLGFDVPASLRPGASLQGVVEASVSEQGGRAVTGRTTVDLHPYPFYIGLRRQREGYASVGQEEEFEFVALDPEGRPASTTSLTVSFARFRWRTILQRDRSGRYRYISEKSIDPIDSRAISSATEPGSFTFVPPTWGQYRVAISDPGSGATTAVTFYASGSGYTPWSMDRPGEVDLELDRPSYRSGDRARVLVKAPFGGRLLLTVEREKVLYDRWIVMDGNTTEVQLPVPEEFLPNAYVTATLVRSIDSVEEQAPMRAYGTVPIYVDASEHEIEVGLECPEVARPNRTMPVTVRLSDDQSRPIGGSGSGAFVTIAAVDEGILQLTDFRTPDPSDFFYGKKRLGVTTYDIFALLLPEEERSSLFSSPGGDRAAAIQMGHLSPATARRVKPVALWSGILGVGEDGSVRTDFEIPEYNGQLRVMAVASAGDRFGAGARDVVVRDPIVLTPTFPRFLGPGDEVRIPVTVFNGTGAAGSFSISLNAEGPAQVVGDEALTVRLAADEEIAAAFSVRALNSLGTVEFLVTAEGGGHLSESRTEVGVRPAAPPISETGAGSVLAGDPGTFRMPANWMSGTASYTLTVTPFPAIEFAGGLQYLLRYPHGCVEQTTSKAFPLVYFNDLAQVADPEMFASAAPEYYLEEAILKLTGMQLSDGGFAFWPNGLTASEWGSMYALHFLTEARKAGYAVPEGVLRQGAKYARTILFAPVQAAPGKRPVGIYRWTARHRQLLQTYSGYVLSLMGSPERGALNHLLEATRDDLSSEGRVLLAGAFALAGDTETGFRLLPTSIRPVDTVRETGRTFGSSVRNTALILSILADVAPDHPSIGDLVRFLSERAEAGRWGTTQENAWAFMALGKILRTEGDRDYTGTLFVDGASRGELLPEPFSISGDDLGGQEIRIEIEGSGRAYYRWEARGIPVGQTFREADEGLQLRRRYLDVAGAPARPDSLIHGDMYVVELRVQALGQSIDNLVIDDMLPAGLEIENPRLESRAAVDWLPDNTLTPEHMDIRDDRLLLYLNLRSGVEQRFYYAVRAVTAGDFVLPPVTGECMYDPALRSVSSSGSIRVVRR